MQGSIVPSQVLFLKRKCCVFFFQQLILFFYSLKLVEVAQKLSFPLVEIIFIDELTFFHLILAWRRLLFDWFCWLWMLFDFYDGIYLFDDEWRSEDAEFFFVFGDANSLMIVKGFREFCGYFKQIRHLFLFLFLFCCSDKYFLGIRAE